jgi:hypothetical protein
LSCACCTAGVSTSCMNLSAMVIRLLGVTLAPVLGIFEEEDDD